MLETSRFCFLAPNQFNLERVSVDGSEPLSLAAVKAHCRVDTTDDDALLLALISAARDTAERITGRVILASTWKLTLDRFPHRFDNLQIRLPRAPVQAVSAISYLDMAGAVQTLAPSAYEVSDSRIAPVFGQIWPVTRPGIGAVTITFAAGYLGGNPLPETITQAMLLMVASWYANREDIVVTTAQAQQIPRAADFLLNLNKLSHVGFEVAS